MVDLIMKILKIKQVSIEIKFKLH